MLSKILLRRESPVVLLIVPLLCWEFVTFEGAPSVEVFGGEFEKREEMSSNVTR